MFVVGFFLLVLYFCFSFQFNSAYFIIYGCRMIFVLVSYISAFLFNSIYFLKQQQNICFEFTEKHVTSYISLLVHPRIFHYYCSLKNALNDLSASVLWPVNQISKDLWGSSKTIDSTRDFYQNNFIKY